ncbi:hypothetical protein AB1Y20_005303 [Prymnesium parvum]|uniref:Uncharacterized protein n=1 Tax=Prymnesium parvum TaxID=97485 RepID=A0AB34J3F2_PRYPA
MRSLQTATALRTWRMAQLEAQHEHMVRSRVVSALLGRAVLGAWHTWMHARSEARVLTQRTSRSTWARRGAIRRWAENASAVRALRGAMARLQRRGECMAFGRWSATAGTRAHDLRLMRLGLSGLVRRLERQAWRSWEAAAASRAQACKAVARWRWMGGYRALSTWRAYASSRKATVAVAARALGLWTASGRTHAYMWALQRWSIGRPPGGPGHAAARAWVLRLQRRSLSSWLHVVVEHRCREAALRAWSSVGQRQAMNSWVADTQLRAAAQQRSALGTEHRLRHVSHVSFRTWKETARSHGTTALRVAQHISSRRLRRVGSAIRHWSSCCKERQRQLSVMRRSFRVMRSLQTATALRTWRMAQLQAQHEHMVRSRVVSALLGRAVLAAWHTWMHARSEARVLTQRTSRSTWARRGAIRRWAENASAVRALRGAMARLQRRSECMAFGRWSATAGTRAHDLRLMRLGLSGLVRRLERQAWRSWEAAAASRAQACKAVARWRWMGGYRALSTWRAYASSRKATVAVAARALGLWTASGRTYAYMWALQRWSAWARTPGGPGHAAARAWVLRLQRRALSSWLHVVVEHRCREAALRAWSSVGQRQAMNSWVADTQLRAAAQQRSALGTEHRLRHVSHVSFRTWKETARSHGTTALRVAQRISSRRLRRVESAIRHWSSCCKERQRQLSVMRRSFRVMRSLQTATALRTWRMAQLQAQHEHMVRSRVVSALLGRAVLAAWHTWVHARSEARVLTQRTSRSTWARRGAIRRWAENASAVRALRGAMARLQRRSECMAFGRWSATAGTRAHDLRLMRLGLSGLVRRLERQAWRSWEAAAASRAQACKAVARWRWMGGYRALSTWRAYASSRKATVAVAARALGLWTASGRTHAYMWALQRWSAWARTPGGPGHAAARAWVLRLQRRALSSWLHVVVEHRCREAALRAWSSVGQRQAMNSWVADTQLRAAAQQQSALGTEHRLRHVSHVSFRTWKETARSHGTTALRVAQHISSRRLRRVGSAIRHWSSCCKERQRQLSVMRRSFRVMRSLQTATALRTWRMAQLEAQHEHMVRSRVVSALLGRAVLAAWHTWVHARSEARVLTQRTSRSTWARRGAIRRWAENASAVRALRGAMARLQRRSECMAFGRWSATAGTRAHDLRLMRLGLSGLVRRLERQAWRSWEAAAASRAQACKAVARWRWMGGYRALSTWRAYASSRKATVAVAARALGLWTASGRTHAYMWALQRWSAWARTPGGPGHAAARAWVLRLQRRALSSWLHVVVEHRCREAALRAWSSVGQRQAMNSWVADTQLRAAAQQRSALGTEHRLRHVSHVSFRTWKETARSHGTTALRVAQRISSRRLRRVGSAIRHWSSCCKERQRQLSVMRRSFRVMRSLQTATALRTWRMAQLQAQHEHMVRSRVVSALLGRAVLAAWHTWVHARSEARVLTQRTSRSTWARRGAIRRWAENASAVRALRGAMARLQRRSECMAFGRWSATAGTRAHDLRLMRLGLSGLVRRLERQAWRSWEAAAASRAQACKAVARWRWMGGYRALSTWRAYASSRKATVAVAARALGLWTASGRTHAYMWALQRCAALCRRGCTSWSSIDVGRLR